MDIEKYLKKEKIEKMFSIAEDFPKIEDELIERYFRNMDASIYSMRCSVGGLQSRYTQA